MGWITHKSKKWEIANLWFLAYSIINPYFLSFAFLYAGIMIKKSIYFLFFVLFLIATSVLSRNGFSSILFFLVWIAGIALLVISSKSFLEKLEIGCTQPLEWNRIPIRQKPVNQNAELENKLFINKLAYWRKEIEDSSIQNNLDKMQEIAVHIATKDQGVSELFFARHADVVDKLLSKYDEIENAGLSTPEIEESKEQIISVISKARRAFEQELVNMHKSEMLELTAESEAYLQYLQDKGLVE